MSRKATAAEKREAELVTEIAAFDKLADDGGDRDLSARVQAKAKASGLRKELAQLRAELEASAVRDPVKRLELLRQRAAADGSWIAAAQLGKQIEEAMAKAEAERKRKEEEAKKDPKRLAKKLQTALHRLPDSLREEVLKPFLRG